MSERAEIVCSPWQVDPEAQAEWCRISLGVYGATVVVSQWELGRQANDAQRMALRAAKFASVADILCGGEHADA
jgi:hypothetical protein